VIRCVGIAGGAGAGGSIPVDGSMGRWGRDRVAEGRLAVGRVPGTAGCWARARGPRQRVDRYGCRRMCPRGALRSREGGSSVDRRADEGIARVGAERGRAVRRHRRVVVVGGFRPVRLGIEGGR
jgi:hypothetical protein